MSICFKPAVTIDYSKLFYNKKVLLRECKRHTACRVASVRYAALSNWGGGGGTPSSLGWGWGGTPSSLGRGGWVIHPVLDGGYPIQSSTGGVPHPVHPVLGTPPVLILDESTPPSAGWGTPPPPSRPGMG